MKNVLTAVRTALVFVMVVCCYHTTYAQASCNCDDFLYLNDERQGITHKFTINPTSLAEIDGDPNTGGVQPWVDFANFGFSGNQSPHGLASDQNGFLYIGNTFTGNDPEDGIYRFDCDGNFNPTSQNAVAGGQPTPYLRTDAAPGGFQNGASTGTNFLNYGNFLVHNLRAEGVIVISEFCDNTGEPDFDVGRIVLPEGGDAFEQWGLGQGADGMFYATMSTNSLTLLIYRADPTTFDFSGTNTLAPGVDVTNIILAEFADPANNAGTNPTDNDVTLQGIDADAAGNVYVFVNSFGGANVESGVFKLDPTLTTVLESDIFINGVDNRPGAGRGLLYDEKNNRVYVSGGQSLNNQSTFPDCISTYDVNLNYLPGLSIPYVSGQQPKGIALATECCPINPTAAIDTSICNPVVGTMIFLQDFVGCEGSVCATTFAPGAGNTGVSFDACNNTITVTDPANVCAEFTVTSASSSCASLNLVLTIEGSIPVTATVAGDQTVCSGDAPTQLTATAAGASSFQWQISTTSATDGFTNIGGATSATYQPGVVSQTTYFRVITTADGACPGVGTYCSETSNAVTVSVISAPSATLSSTDATCTGATLNTDATVTASGIANGDRVGISAGSSYTGAGYGGLAANNASDGTETFMGLAANTTYTVRVFNGSDGCFVDFMITTNDVVCAQPCSITGGIINQVCSDNGTNNDAGDDTYAITVTATIMNGVSMTYEVFDGTTVVATGTSGSPVTFNTPADGGTETYTLRVQGDAACTTTGQTTQQLNPCSTPDPCSITGSITNQACNDNGTNNDAGDDTYAITVTATIMNGVSMTYEVFDGTSVVATGTSGSSVTFNTPADGGTETYTLRVQGDAACTTAGQTTQQLNSCSTPDPCSITGSITSQVCNDNGTNNDAGDDTYAITVTATIMNGVSMTYEVFDGTTVVATGTSGSPVTFNTPADGGTETYTLRVQGDAACTTAGQTTQQLNSCSTPDPCSITGSITSQVCNDNGTNNDAGDDTYAITVTATIMNGVSMTYEVFDGTTVVATGTSGSPVTFNTPADGSTETYTLRVQGDAACTTAGQTTQTLSPCSTPDPCSITGSITSQVCNDNGTNNDAGDDTYAITVTATIMNGVSMTYEVFDGTTVVATGTSGTPVTFNTPADGSTETYTLRVQGDAACTTAGQMTQTLSPCSTPDPCSITGSITSQVCNDNGTNNDAGDDTYTITVTATIMNGTSATYEVLDANNAVVATGTSGMTTTFVTPADGGTETYTLRDQAETTCVSGPVTTQTLSSCSTPDPCSITGSITDEQCSDNGTGNDLNDDVYTITVTATIMNGTSTTYEVLDANNLVVATGTSGMTTTFMTPADGGTETYTFRDQAEISCVSAPATTGTLASCSTPVCAITAITSSPGTCVPASNTYSVDVTVTYENAPAGNLVVTAGGVTETVAATTSPQTVTLNGLTADGMLQDVTASFAMDAACTLTETDNFMAPDDCGGLATCTVGFTVIASTTCDMDNNTFGLRLSLDVVDAPPTGDYEVSINGGPFFTAPRNDFSPTTMADSIDITGLDCDTELPKIVEVRFADQPSCATEIAFFFSPIDPAGYIYCVDDGSLVREGQVEVTTPPGGDFMFLTQDGRVLDGSDGRYAFVAVGPPGLPVVNGEYGITYVGPRGETLVPNPATFGDNDDILDPTAGTGDNPDGDDPLNIGSDVTADGQNLQDFTLAANPYFTRFDLAGGDPFVDLNNLPLECDLCSVEIAAGLEAACTFNASTQTNSFTLTGLTVTTFDVPAGEELVVSFNGNELGRMVPDASGTTTFPDYALTETVSFANVLDVRFASSTECGQFVSLDLIACTPACTNSPDEIGGNVFNDINVDGADAGAGVEERVSNVLVQVYDCNDELVCEVYTNADGEWSCDGLTAGDSLRVEFSTPLQPLLSESFAGDDNGTSVQFVQPGNCEVDYAVMNEDEFCTEDPDVIITCFVVGDPANGIAPSDVVVSYPSSRTGVDPNSPDWEAPMVLINKGEAGSVWGLAYDRSAEQIYTSAFLKRHSGLVETDPETGALLSNPLGAIFRSSATGGGAELFVNLADLGLNVGIIPDNASRGVDVAPNQPSVDSLAFTRIAEVGIGDISLSIDGRTLYAVNLFSKELVVIPIMADGSAGTVSTLPIPDPGCSGGEVRPFAVTTRADGSVFVGVVCDASVSQLTADLQATVFRLSPGATTFTPVFSTSLAYEKGFTLDGGTCLDRSGWFAWTDMFPEPCRVVTNPNNGRTERTVSYPQPILSNIDFDTDGSMVLSFTDRLGHQLGYRNADLVGTPEIEYRISSVGGDILRVNFDNGTYTLEDNGSAGGVTTNGAGNGQGPGGGEYYFNDVAPDNVGMDQHQENGLGSSVINPFNNQLISAMIRPGSNTFSSTNGTTVMDVTTGELILSPDPTTGEMTSGYSLFRGTNNGGGPFEAGLFGKAAGLGELILTCPAPPIQIGNYAWIDIDRDGVQDACEPPVEGLTVTLYGKDDAGNPTELLATTTTDANGNYYFAGDGLDDATWEDVEEDTLVVSNDYFIAFSGPMGYDAEQGTLVIDGVTYRLTTPNVGQGDNPDLDDSDITEQTIGDFGTFPAYMTMRETRTSNHTFDAGFIVLCPFVDLADDLPSLCGTDTVALSAIVDSVFTSDEFEYVWSTDGDGVFLDAAGAETTDFDTAVSYQPGATDIRSGAVTLGLRATTETTPGICPEAVDMVTITILNVDCGSFFWDGDDD